MGALGPQRGAQGIPREGKWGPMGPPRDAKRTPREGKGSPYDPLGGHIGGYALALDIYIYICRERER